MNLNELVNSFLGRQGGDGLPEAVGTPDWEMGDSGYFRQISDDRRHARNQWNVMLASWFWSTVLENESLLLQALRKNGIDLSMKRVNRAILNYNPDADVTGCNLILLSATDSAAEGRLIKFGDFVKKIGGLSELLEFDARKRTKHNAIWRPSDPDFFEQVTFQEKIDFVNSQDFNVIYGRMPEVISTSGVATSPLGISLYKEGKAISSIGVIATDRNGISGVTASLHGIFDDADEFECTIRNQGIQSVLGKEVYINGKPGIIRNADIISDSCFIEFTPDGQNIFELNGPMASRIPYVPESVDYIGLRSDHRTVITGIDMGLHLVHPNRQLRVYTNPVTNPGDSGAALCSQDGYVVGFGHFRTGYGEPIEFSEWIWALSVYQSLNIS